MRSRGTRFATIIANRRAAGDKAIGGTDAQRRWLAVAATEESVRESGTVTGERRLDPRWVAAVQAEFSQRDWLVFWRVVVDGQTAGEAGAEHGMTSNAVRLVKMRVLRRFRQISEAGGS